MAAAAAAARRFGLHSARLRASPQGLAGGSKRSGRSMTTNPESPIESSVKHDEIRRKEVCEMKYKLETMKSEFHSLKTYVKKEVTRGNLDALQIAVATYMFFFASMSAVLAGHVIRAQANP